MCVDFELLWGGLQGIERLVYAWSPTTINFPYIATTTADTYRFVNDEEWVLGPPLPIPLREGGATVLGSTHVIIAGGTELYDYGNRSWKFELATGKWTEVI